MKPGSSFSTRTCLTPGKHKLRLHDPYGFGGMGLHVSVLRASDREGVYQQGSTLVKLRMPSAPSCQSPCPLRFEGETCFDQLFTPVFNASDPLAAPEFGVAPRVRQCDELVMLGCGCAACCIVSDVSEEKWSEMRQGHQPASKGPAASEVSFEVAAPVPRDPQRLAPSPLPPPPSPAHATFACAESALGEGRVTGLHLHNGVAYEAEVRAFDRAGNMVAGCGPTSADTAPRGRLSSELEAQRPITIDAAPPVHNASGIRDLVLDQQYLASSEDSDHLLHTPLRLRCDWDAARFVDPESGVVGFQWALSTDRIHDNVLAWHDAGTVTHGAAISHITGSSTPELVRAIRPPPSPPIPPSPPSLPPLLPPSPSPPALPPA